MQRRAPVLLLLTVVLSLVAGSVDVISFLGLGGLFTAHITGNLVILAAHIVSGGDAPVAPMLSVPVFMAALGLSRLFAAGIEAIGVGTARPLLLLQFLLLVGFLALCLAAGHGIDPGSPIAIVAGMSGVSAMAVQNALVQIALKDVPTTAVMTSNVTRYAMDLGEILLGGDVDKIARARRRAQLTWPALVGFTLGCGLGAACEARFELWSLMLPTGLALVAFLLGGLAGRAPPSGNAVRARQV